MTDHEIVLQIQEWLDGTVWSPGILREIAEMLTDNGYEVAVRKPVERFNEDTPA